MAGPKHAASKKKAAAARAVAQKKTAKPAPLLKRAARDPLLGPSSNLEKAFRKGTTVTLDSFRNIIDWS